MIWFKSILDYSIGLLLVVLCLPIVIAIWLTIKLLFRCNPIYKQERIGQNGKLFNIIKFRTIDPHTQLPSHRLSTFLRKTNLDELPQLFQVLAGKLSLVGPRPHLAEHVALYEEWQKERLSIKPGITGLRQISTNQKLMFNEYLELDLQYIKSWSPTLDIIIIIKTIGFQLKKFWIALFGS